MPMERVYAVLMVTASEKFAETLGAQMKPPAFDPVCVVSNIAAARRKMAERAFDFVIVNAPLADEFGSKFAVDVSVNSSCVALIFVQSGLYGEIYDKVGDCGVFVLPKPTTVGAVSQGLDWMRSMRERLRKNERKTVDIQEKMEEIRLVNRAKWLLIEQLKMPEADAHRFIEKQAMNLGVSKRKMAENVIQMYS